ncbi:MAG: 2-octaprenyl-3-methyl-6-methoxy,4-benzoquinol hydroxylase [Polaromonas sp.]|nr:2-octaprenyl-3-methyl-6-methoxy,4-benzoquinol hydroxylase [Polaromonas sp.]
MSKPFDVCIRGAGIVGRTLALLLARERLRVALVVQPPRDAAAQAAIATGTVAEATDGAPASTADREPKTDVRAYALNSASRQLLENLRVWPENAFATPVLKMQVWGDDRARLDFSAQALGQPALAWIADVPALEQQLMQAVRYQPQIETVDAPVKAALQVVCEGQKSTSRNEFGATWTVKPYPQKAVAARLISDRPHQGVARQWFHNGEIVALLPVSSTGSGENLAQSGNSVALVWSVGTERAHALQRMPDSEFCAALQQVCGDIPGQLALLGDRSSWPLALSSADRWVGPGWALAGDAAHTVHPLAGQGLNLGLADADSLAHVIAQREYWRGLGDEKLLRRYERARKGDIAAMSVVTDGLHGLFAQTDSRWQGMRDWGMNSFARSGPLKSWVMRRAAGL